MQCVSLSESRYYALVGFNAFKTTHKANGRVLQAPLLKAERSLGMSAFIM